MLTSLRSLFSKTKKAKSKSKSDLFKNISRSFSPETKKKIASFTRKRDNKRGFKKIKRDQETEKKIASFTRKRDTKRGFKIFNRLKEDNKCSICFEQIKDNTPATYTQCNHKFHSECLDRWLNTGNNSCPVCREPIFTGTNRHELELQELRLIIDDRSAALDRLGYIDDLNEEQQAQHDIIYGEFVRAILDYDRYALMHELPLYGEEDEDEDEDEDEEEDEDELWSALIARARRHLDIEHDPYVA